MQAIDDAAVETAILDMLAERAERYPAHLVSDMRRRGFKLPPVRVRTTLDRLFADRRVARLWHRYLLPEAVPEVRTRWLSMLDGRSERLGPEMVARARGILQRWDGWHIGEVDDLGSDHDPKRSRA